MARSAPVFPEFSYDFSEEVGWTTLVGRFIASEWKTNRSGHLGPPGSEGEEVNGWHLIQVMACYGPLMGYKTTGWWFGT